MGPKVFGEEFWALRFTVPGVEFRVCRFKTQRSRAKKKGLGLQGL